MTSLFGTRVRDITDIYLADGEWYEINVGLEIIRDMVDDKWIFYFSCKCIRASDNASLRVIGNVDQILLAEAKYS